MAREGPGTWLMGCGTCPSETRTRNLRVFEWHLPEEDDVVAACPQIDIHGVMDGLRVGSYFSDQERPKVRASVNDELEFCGCGDSDAVDELFKLYFDWLERHWDWIHAQPRVPAGWDMSSQPEKGLSEGEFILIAYLCDKEGWTEHGSSVFGAWLTDDGKEVVENLAKPEYAEISVVPKL